MKNFTLLVTVILFLSACMNKSDYLSRVDKSESVEVAFVNLRIVRTDSGYSVSVTESKLISASLKSLDPRPSRWRENDFFCLVTNKKGYIADSLILVQPLHPRYEFPGENGSIGSQVVELKENDVLLRFRYRRAYKYLRIGIAGKDNHFKTIDTIALSFIN